MIALLQKKKRCHWMINFEEVWANGKQKRRKKDEITCETSKSFQGHPREVPSCNQISHNYQEEKTIRGLHQVLYYLTLDR